MEASQHTGTQEIGSLPSASFKESLADAARFWERGRVIYNLILIGVVATWILVSWPHFRPAMHLFRLFQLMVLGVIANVLYCAAYFVDIPMQSSGVGASWRRWRWALWTLGTILAFVLTNYWIADEIYPFVN